MFDVNPDAAKYYFKDLDRQVAASRRLRAAPGRPAESGSCEAGPDTLVAACRRLTDRAFTSVVRGVAAALF